MKNADQLHISDIYWTLHLIKTKYTFKNSSFGPHYTLSQKISLNKLKKDYKSHRIWSLTMKKLN